MYFTITYKLFVVLDLIQTRQICPGSPPGVWVSSTDMILTIPPDFGEFALSALTI